MDGLMDGAMDRRKDGGRKAVKGRRRKEGLQTGRKGR